MVRCRWLDYVIWCVPSWNLFCMWFSKYAYAYTFLLFYSPIFYIVYYIISNVIIISNQVDVAEIRSVIIYIISQHITFLSILEFLF